MNSVNATQDKLNLRAIFLLALPLLIYGAVILIPDFEIRFVFIDPLYPLILAIGFYLVYLGGSARIVGIIGLILLVGVSALNFSTIPDLNREDGPRLQVHWPVFFRGLIWGSVMPAAVGIMGFVAAVKKETGPSFRAFVLLTAFAVLLTAFAVLLISSFLNGVGLEFFYHMDKYRVSALIRTLVTPLALALFVFVAKDFCKTGGYLFKPSIWARLWCGLVFISTSSLLAYFLSKGEYNALLAFIPQLPLVIGTFLLIFGLRGSFHFVVLGASFVIINLLISMPIADKAWHLVVENIFITIIHFNITAFLVRRALAQAWNPAERPLVRTPLTMPILEVVSLVPGIFMLFMSIGYLSNPRAFQSGIIGLTIAIVWIIVNSIAARQGFRRKGPYVLHALCMMLLAAFAVLMITVFIKNS